jgi:hypothetical protein
MKIKIITKLKPIKILGNLEATEIFTDKEDREVYIDEVRCPKEIEEIFLAGYDLFTNKHLESLEEIRERKITHKRKRKHKRY